MSGTYWKSGDRAIVCEGSPIIPGHGVFLRDFERATGNWLVRDGADIRAVRATYLRPPEDHEMSRFDDGPRAESARPDMVNHPAHYKAANGLEAIDLIEAFGLGFSAGNVIKYVVRAGKKGSALDDYWKAREYLDRLISNLERDAAKETP